jgi:ornithine carbamoyltransferase
VRELFHLAADIKARPDRYRGALEGKFLAMIFEKPSLRTRVTFEVGIASLGGASVFLDHTATRLRARESIRDVAKNLERMVHGIVARVFSQESLDGLADHGRIPVINALSDRFHPCQALSDFFTLEERFGGLLRRPATSQTQQLSLKRNGWRVRPAEKLKLFTLPKMQSQTRRRFTRTCGRAWGKKKNRRRANSRLPVTR